MRVSIRKRSSRRLVEIGAAWGTFALIATRLGFDVTAMDQRGLLRYLGRKSAFGYSLEQRNVPGSLPPSRVIGFGRRSTTCLNPCAPRRCAANSRAEEYWLFPPQSHGHWVPRHGCEVPHVDAPRHLWLFPIGISLGTLSSWGLTSRVRPRSGARRWNSSLVRDPSQSDLHRLLR